MQSVTFMMKYSNDQTFLFKRKVFEYFQNGHHYTKLMS